MSNALWCKRFVSQMKWWYMKRFVTPQVAESYEYIFAIDEDSDPEHIDINGVLEILRTHQIHIAQPALTPVNTNHGITVQVSQYVD